MVGVKLRVGCTFILSIDLIGAKRATVFSLKNENRAAFNCKQTQGAFCLRINTRCTCSLVKNGLQQTYHRLGPASCHNLLLHKTLWEIYKEKKIKKAKQGAVLTVTLASALGDIQNGKLYFEKELCFSLDFASLIQYPNREPISLELCIAHT